MFEPCGKEGCSGIAQVRMGNELVAVPTIQEEQLPVRVFVNGPRLQVFVTIPEGGGEQEVFSIERKGGVYMIWPIATFFVNQQVAATLGMALSQFLNGII